MESKTKNALMVVVVLVCVGIAGAIFLSRSTSGGGAGRVPKTTYVKCINPDCGATFEMDFDKYSKQLKEKIKENPGAMMMGPVAIKCPECGKVTAFKATKCEKCGHIFIPGRNTADGEYADTCPECGYSRIKEIREGKGGGE